MTLIETITPPTSSPPPPSQAPWRRAFSYDRLSALLIFVLVVLVVLTFRHYATSNDEGLQHTYGAMLLDWYASGFTDRSAFTYRNLYLYGGLFDMVAAALAPLTPLPTYELRHLLCGLVGVAGVVAVWRLGRLLAGPRAGFLAALLLAVSAAYYGAMFTHTKDIPFAVGMAWVSYLICRLAPELPRPPLRLVFWLGVVTGLSLGIRVGAVFAVIYVTAVLAVDGVGTAWRHGWRRAAARSAVGCLALLPALPVAYALMAVLWPWSAQSPLNPVESIEGLTHFSIRTLVAGRYYDSLDLPGTYLPTYLAAKVPEIVLIGVALSIGFSVWMVARTRGRAAGHGKGLQWLVVVISMLFPLAYALVTRPALYNGMRHFLFVIPPMCVVAAVGWEMLWRRAQARNRVLGMAVAAVLGLGCAKEVRAMLALHPHEYIYYNALVGGVAGADKRYELDYWSNFVPEAIAWLDADVAGDNVGRRYRVGMCTEPAALESLAPRHLVWTEDWSAADFVVASTNAGCDTNADGRIVFSVERDGAVIGVVKDRRDLLKPND